MRTAPAGGSNSPAPARPEAAPSRLLPWTILALLVVLIASKAIDLAEPASGRGASFIDFDAFRVAGHLVWRGAIEQAYRFETLLAFQRSFGEPNAFLPWTYPPVFNLVVAPFALLPRGLAYAVFTGSTLVAYLLILRRLAGPHLGPLLALVFPALAVTVACGQNGFLTGSLVGAACLSLMRRDPRAGIPLGLMAIKPHLAVGFALQAVMTRDWRTALIAASVATTFAALATLLLGPGVWGAFREGVGEAGVFLERGLYPLYRMISAYAVVRSLGAPAAVALAVQAGIAILALGLIGLAIRRRMPFHQVAGLTTLATLLVSPYAYDYDLPILGVGLALLGPDLLMRATHRTRLALFALVWIACGWGLAMTGLLHHRYGETDIPLGVTAPSLGGLALVAAIGLIWRILSRQPLRAPASDPADRSSEARGLAPMRPAP